MHRWIIACILLALMAQAGWAEGQEKVLDKFPIYSQGSTEWCAWVSAQMALDYYGYKVSPKAVAEETFRLAGQTWGGKPEDLLEGKYNKYYDNAIKSLSNDNLYAEKIDAQNKDDLLFKIFDAIDRGYPIILESNGPWLYDANDIPQAFSWWFTPESSWPSGGHASVIVGYSLNQEYNLNIPISFKFITNLLDNPPAIKIHDPATAALGYGTYWVSYDKLFEKIIYHASSTRLIIVKPIPVNNILPTILAFNVTPLSLISEESFEINYTVADTGGSGLKQTELWRKNETSDWQQISTNTLAGEIGPLSSSFTDSPPTPGKYWYGVHVVDNAGNWNDEKNSNTNNKPGVYGPIEVETKTETEPVASATQSSGNSVVGSWTLHLDEEESCEWSPQVACGSNGGCYQYFEIAQITFSSDGTFEYNFVTGGEGVHRGSWVQNGDNIHMEKIEDSKIFYDGTVKNDTMYGVMRRGTTGKTGCWAAYKAGYTGTIIPFPSPVTLILYVHSGSNGPIIPGAQVTGRDGSDNNFQQTTDSSGSVTITGDTGTWSFSASAPGYDTNNWDQEINKSGTKHAFLVTVGMPSNKDRVTLTLYVHEGDRNGPVIPDAAVTVQDGSGNSFEQTTDNDGYVTITGDPGTWSFSASADGYKTNSWDQEISKTAKKHAFLQCVETQQESQDSIDSAARDSENSVVGKWIMESDLRCDGDPHIWEITLNADGTLEEDSDYHWEQQGNAIHLQHDPEYDSKNHWFTYDGTINGNIMYGTFIVNSKDGVKVTGCWSAKRISIDESELE